MISYAQNFEDVMLARAFDSTRVGFYIDVGAMDPVESSVTKHFYDAGWSGVNIEPDERFYQKLMAERGRDVNLLTAAGDIHENRTLFRFDAQGISTFRPEFRDYFTERQFKYREVTVPVTTLADVCRQYVKTEIEFLKIDAEGWEGPIIAGADWNHFRPVVLILEATKPYSHDLDCAEWEPKVLQAGYQLVYFDGLNRFYVRQEDSGLATRFAFPPNVTDGFITHHTVVLGREKDALQNRIQELQMAQSTAKPGEQSVERSRIEDLELMVNDFRVKFETAWKEKEAERLRNQSMSAELIAVRSEIEIATQRYEQYRERNQELAAAMEDLWGVLEASQRGREEMFRRNHELAALLEAAYAKLRIESQRNEVLSAKEGLLERSLRRNEELTETVTSLLGRIDEFECRQRISTQQVDQLIEERGRTSALLVAADIKSQAVGERNSGLEVKETLLDESLQRNEKLIAGATVLQARIDQLEGQQTAESERVQGSANPLANAGEAETNRLRSWLGRVSQDKAALALKLDKVTKELQEHRTQARIGDELYTDALTGVSPDKIATEILSCPDVAYAGSSFSITIRLSNNTDHHLVSSGPNPVHLSYRWYDAGTNACIISEGARTALGIPLRARSARDYQMTVVAPAESKEYILQSCVVQHLVMWFDQPTDKCRKRVQIKART